jgi:hypothetical protein
MKRKASNSRKKNMWPFGPSPRSTRQTTPARGGIAAHAKTRKKAATSAGTQYKGYSIRLLEDGSYVIPKIDPDTQFEDLKQAKRFVDSETKARRNAAGDRVEVIPSTRRKGMYDVLVGGIHRVTKPTLKGAEGYAKTLRGNPANSAAEAYTDFHGRPSEEVVTVKTEVHYHKHLAACGELRKLVVKPVDKLFTVSLSGFKKALLAFNEKRTQLFIEGGDQSVDLKQFGIKTPHEVETLGEVRVIEYFTIKDHLGKDGGRAVYVHKFHKPYPVLSYHTLDQRLEFSGGSYVVLAEGIDK